MKIIDLSEKVLSKSMTKQELKDYVKQATTEYNKRYFGDGKIKDYMLEGLSRQEVKTLDMLYENFGSQRGSTRIKTTVTGNKADMLLKARLIQSALKSDISSDEYDIKERKRLEKARDTFLHHLYGDEWEDMGDKISLDDYREMVTAIGSIDNRYFEVFYDKGSLMDKYIDHVTLGILTATEFTKTLKDTFNTNKGVSSKQIIKALETNLREIASGKLK